MKTLPLEPSLAALRDKATTVPAALARLAERLPAYPPSLAFAAVLNRALGRLLPPDALAPLHGKRVSIRVTDLGARFHFTVEAAGFRAVREGGTPDLAISATARDFYLLATRKEDPDTLFFNRRLVVEGDTELGLVAKNTLDGLDLPRPDLAALAPARLLEKVRLRLLG